MGHLLEAQPPMTPGEEMALYRSDRSAWLTQAAPRLAARFYHCSDADMSQRWAFLSRDYQRAVWHALDDPQRTRLQRIRAAEGAGAGDGHG